MFKKLLFSLMMLTCINQITYSNNQLDNTQPIKNPFKIYNYIKGVCKIIVGSVSFYQYRVSVSLAREVEVEIGDEDIIKGTKLQYDLVTSLRGHALTSLSLAATLIISGCLDINKEWKNK